MNDDATDTTKMALRSERPSVAPPITFPTWKKYTIMGHCISNMDIRSKRRMFAAIRATTPTATCDHYYPKCGITLGEFAIWYQLNSKKKSEA